MGCGSVLAQVIRIQASFENTVPLDGAFLPDYRMHLFFSGFEGFPAFPEDQSHCGIIYIVSIGLCLRIMVVNEYRWKSHDRSLNIFPNIHKFHTACLWRELFSCKSLKYN